MPYWYRYERLLGLGEFAPNNVGAELDTKEAINNYRVQRLINILPKQGMATVDTIPENKDRSMYSCKRYSYFLDAPFDISNACCTVMKKSPAKKYAKETGRKPITAQMATESKLRTQQWLKNGCNGFNMKSPISNPMAFWTEEDVLAYIKIFNLPICSVYGDIVIDDGTPMGKTIESTEGWLEAGVFDNVRPPLKTTGCSRTGCVFCGYGCHLEKEGEGRFERLKETHPQLYEYLMRPWEETKEEFDPKTGETKTIIVQGLNYREIIDWMNEHGNLHIRY